MEESGKFRTQFVINLNCLKEKVLDNMGLLKDCGHNSHPTGTLCFEALSLQFPPLGKQDTFTKKGSHPLAFLPSQSLSCGLTSK